MKWLAIVALLLLGDARAQARSSLSIDAHEVSSGAYSADEWKTSWGSYDRTTVASKVVEVAVRNFGNAPIKTEATIYFISHGAEVGHASRSYEFTGPGEVRGRVVAPLTFSRTLNLEAIGYNRTAGLSPVTNWFVIARVNDTIVALKGSDPATQTELEQKVRAGRVR